MIHSNSNFHIFNETSTTPFKSDVTRQTHSLSIFHSSVKSTTQCCGFQNLEIILDLCFPHSPDLSAIFPKTVDANISQIPPYAVTYRVPPQGEAGRERERGRRGGGEKGREGGGEEEREEEGERASYLVLLKEYCFLPSSLWFAQPACSPRFSAHKWDCSQWARPSHINSQSRQYPR